MGNITGRFLLPHPPYAVPEVGGKQAKEFKHIHEGFTAAGTRIAALKPQTIILLTPHGPCFSDHFYVPDTRRISGDLSLFGGIKIILGFDNDTALAKRLSQESAAAGLSLGPLDHKTMKRYGIPYDLDYGVVVPLYFINHFYNDYRLLPIDLSGMTGKDHYRLGMIIRQCVERGEDDVVIIASGNLSRHTSAKTLPESNVTDAVFDEKIRALLVSGESLGLLDFDPALKQNTTQCCFNPLLTLAGTMDGNAFATDILAYENRGTGYLCAALRLTGAKPSVLANHTKNAAKRNADRIAGETAPQRLARTALREYLAGGGEINVPAGTDTNLCERSGGVFVFIKIGGELIGSHGSVKATQPNLAAEIIAHTVGAAKSLRTAPLNQGETDDLSFTVDFLSEPEAITDLALLDHRKYGVIVENHGKIGVLPPDFPGIGSVDEQLRAAKENAGIHPWRSVKIKRFFVIRHDA